MGRGIGDYKFFADKMVGAIYSRGTIGFGTAQKGEKGWDNILGSSKVRDTTKGGRVGDNI